MGGNKWTENATGIKIILTHSYFLHPTQTLLDSEISVLLFINLHSKEFSWERRPKNMKLVQR